MMIFRSSRMMLGLGAIFALTLSHMPTALSISIGSIAEKETPFSRGGGRGNKAVMRMSKKRKQKIRAKKIAKGAKNRR